MKNTFTKKARYLGLKLTAMLFALLLISGESWGVNIINVRTDVTGSTATGWTDTDVTGTTYLQLLKSTSVSITPAMNFDNYTSEALNFKARTFGGTTAAEIILTVWISTDNGNNWTNIGTRTPGSSTLTAVTAFDISSYNGTQVKIKFTVGGTNDAIGVGIDDITISGTSSNPSITTGTITGFGNVTVNTTSSEKSYSVSGSNLTDNITITPPSGFEISTGTGAGFVATSPITLTQSGGSVASTTIYVRFKPTAIQAYSGNISHTTTNGNNPDVAVSGTGIAPSNPATFTATASTSTQINLSATANTNGNNIVVIYNSSGTFTTPTDGVAAGNVGDALASGTIIYKGSAASITNHTGLTPSTVYYYKAFSYDASNYYSSGSTANATTNGIDAPVATAATNLTSTGFTANWNMVAGATSYRLDVSTASDFGLSIILSENFTGFTTNNGSTDRSSTLDTYLQTTGWTGAAVYEMIGYTKMGSGSAKGILTTPTIDLSGNSGNAILTFDLSKYGTDATIVQVFHASDGTTFSQIGSDITAPASMTTQTINITGGTANSKIMIAAKNASNYRFYLDNIIVKQENSAAILSGYNDLTVNTTNQVVSGLSSNTNYYYRVRAYSSSGTSINSNTITVLTSASLSTITTTVVSQIGSTTVSSGGNVTSNGGATVTGRGVCWNTTGNPTISDNLLADVSGGNGIFTSSITGLSPNTTYYLKAYATNIVGTSYGDVQTFTTISVEPTNHALSFTATASSTTAITTTWADNDGAQAASGFLVMKNTSNSFTNPVDGVPQSDGANVKNITHGVQTYQWTGLTAGTHYYFKIYPYNGTGTEVNYKTDGTVPTADAFTNTATVTANSGGSVTLSSIISSGGAEPNITVSGNTTLNVTTSASVSNVVVEAGSSVIVSPSQTLDVFGDLTIESPNNLGPIATFINNGTTNVAGSSNVQRYLPAYTSAADGWHLISCPFNNYTIAGSVFEPAANEDLFAWRENDFTFLNYTVPLNGITAFNQGQGYLTAYNSSGVKTFTSSTLPLINNDVTLLDNASLNSSLSASTRGWHLVGNSFTSDVLWDDAPDWMALEIVKTFSVWNDAANNYLPVQTGGHIPALQGFFVQVTNATNLLVLPKSARTNNTATYNKSTTYPMEQMNLKVTSNVNSYYDVTYVGFNNQATINFDNNYDSRKLSGGQTAPQLYSVVQGVNLSVNMLPKANATSVPIGFKAFANGNYTITASDITSIPLCTSVLLEDLKTNTTQNLMQNPVYNFTATTTDNANRFVLHFATSVGVNETGKTNTGIYAYDNNIYVNGAEQISQIAVYNTLGQLIKTLNNVNGLQKISMNGNATGYYIVKVITDSKVYSEKVLVK